MNNEIRHVLNLAQVLAVRDTNLRLVTFDGDCTLYSDGSDFSDVKLARFIALPIDKRVSVSARAQPRKKKRETQTGEFRKRQSLREANAPEPACPGRRKTRRGTRGPGSTRRAR